MDYRHPLLPTSSGGTSQPMQPRTSLSICVDRPGPDLFYLAGELSKSGQSGERDAQFYVVANLVEIYCGYGFRMRMVRHFARDERW